MTCSLEFNTELPVLVVPDVHQDLVFLQRAVALAEQEGAGLAFLGDYVDSINPRWRNAQALEDIAKALPQLAQSHRHGCLFLAGNHDVMALKTAHSRARQLISGHDDLIASLQAGLQPENNYSALIGAWPGQFLHTWQIAAVCHGFILSHAGVARRFWPWAAAPDHIGQTKAFIESSSRAWICWLEEGTDNPLFAVGPARGGKLSPIGGPLWMDWDAEFVDDLELPQIVGHTRGHEPRRKNRSWCIDASQSCVGLLDPSHGLRLVKL
ncbi:hypothetical protein IMCC26134_13650 [Verrucomicrobia bacterium IMCC26134]|nr:hypothetical protein IMCC26134_13650 [Verrucomicrobia bacterium IMCC26134]